MENLMNNNPADTYEGQLAERAAAIERIAAILATEGYTAPELRAVAGGCDLYLRIADAVEALGAP
jgi:hypothetical protein